MTDPPWTPEHVVGAAEARALIAAQGWGLELARVSPFGEGFDNTAFLVDGAWVFRFPRRQVAAPLLLREAALLPAIAARVSLAVPVPCLVGQPNARFPWAFTGYRLLPGRTACEAGLSEAQRAMIAAPVGRFLAALHAFPVDEARALGAVGDEWGKLDVSVRAGRTREEVARLRELGLVDDAAPAAAERVIAAVAEVGARPPAVLVHGDLYSQHVVVDADGMATGVIDWGDVHVGDRALDLAFAWIFLPPAGREAFCRAYGPVDEETWRLARFRALFHAAVDMRYAVAVGDAALAREGRLTLAWVLAG